MDKDKKNIQQINIELDEKISSGEYANFVVVTHSPAEFVMDFTRLLPGVPKAKVHSRIIMAPQHAKAYLAALNRANYVLKNIPNSTEKQRALDIMKKSFIELGYEEYAEKVSSVEALN